MSKWIIKNIELIKKTYVVEAYGEPAAKLAAKAQAPTQVETIGEVAFDVTAINEYEYNKDWVELASGREKLKDQEDWVDTITTGGKIRHRSEWVYAHKDGRAENPPHGAGTDPKQRYRGPDVNEIR